MFRFFVLALVALCVSGFSLQSARAGVRSLSMVMEDRSIALPFDKR